MSDGTNGAHREGWRRGGLFLSALLVLWNGSAIAAPFFGRPGAFRVDGSPVGVVALEINNQPGLDLVTGNEAGADGPSISLLFNLGQGSYLTQQPRELNALFILHSITAGDFTNDGNVDLALSVTDLTDGFPPRAAAVVMRNNGRGGFLSPQATSLSGLFPEAIAAADVSGDGTLDLVVGHSVQIQAELEGRVSLLRGRGGGGFMVPIEHRVGTAPSALAVADLDNDRLLDVVVADADARRVFLLWGNSGPTYFDPPVLLTLIDDPSGVAVADVNPRSLPDILVTSESGGQLFTFHQTARRQFAMPSATGLGCLASNMAVADFDADGFADVVVTCRDGSSISLWYGDGRGGFEFGETVRVGAGSEPDGIVVADLNDDTLLDVAVSSSRTDSVSVVLQGANVPGSGDANCDGELTDADIRAVIEQIFFQALQICPSADVDFDGRVTAADLVAIVKLRAGG
jgi:hypothetical protein